MSESDRNELIDAYFDALDSEDPEIVRPALADGFVYESPSGDLEGFSGFETYMNELRGFSNTTHEVTRRIHDEDVSVAEGTVTGDGDGTSLQAGFCNVFEFDDDEAGLTRIAVYINDA